ncbi:MAG: 4-hydroxybenzoate octaprenyltransferase [Planctomycetes bacterium]|nr:4-hydroxybenzoate octaprenyltransferase [Planctomycetota bacterium]
MKQGLSAVRIWADMVKLSHSVFALPFALMAAFMAGRHIEGHGRPYWGQLGLVLVCMVAARSVAMTFNRIVDASLDARNPRTAMRPLPAGRLSLTAAWIMLAISTVTFGVGCLGFYVYYENTWPILLSGPVLLYLCGYSYTKRFTKWAHYYLGTAIALSPVAAWLAVLLPLDVEMWFEEVDGFHARWPGTRRYIVNRTQRGQTLRSQGCVERGSPRSFLNEAILRHRHDEDIRHPPGCLEVSDVAWMEQVKRPVGVRDDASLFPKPGADTRKLLDGKHSFVLHGVR